MVAVSVRSLSEKPNESTVSGTSVDYWIGRESLPMTVHKATKYLKRVVRVNWDSLLRQWRREGVLHWITWKRPPCSIVDAGMSTTSVNSLTAATLWQRMRWLRIWFILPRWGHIFTAWRYASAVYAMALSGSVHVCLSINKFTDGRVKQRLVHTVTK